jgi:aminopeptidase N
VRTLWPIVALAACHQPPSSPVPPDPERGVSLELAAERARSLANLRYELAFEVPAASTEPIAGRAVIHFEARDLSRPLVLDFDAGADAAASVTVAGRPSGARAVNGHLLIPPGELVAGDNTVEISFQAGDASLNRNADFFYTLFVPARAHLAFPCFDQPDLKGRYTLELTVPTGWRAVANGAEISSEPSRDRRRVRFAATPPIPTYLFAFAAGRFDVETAERGGRTLRMFHRETDRTKLARNRDAVFDLHAAALRWLEDYTAIPYQFGKFDFVALPAFQFSGMEHPGAVFYSAPALLLDESATESQLLNRASLIAHETSHMWFGDLVTMRWFDDVWMKEVFANFMAARIVNPSFPAVNHDLRFLTAHYPAAYAVDRTEGTHPIRQDLANLDDAGSLYGAIIYQKAPIVMRQLELLVGADALREGLRAYLKQFRFANATWLDLVRILDERADQDLAAWSRAWVEEAGRPTIQTIWQSAGERAPVLAFVQTDPREGRGLRWTQRLDVLLGTKDGARRLSLDLGDGRIDVSGALLPPQLNFVLPTGGGLAYGAFVLDERSRSFLLAHADELDDPVARGAVWITLWDEMLDGRIAPPALVDSALRALTRETVEQNVQLLVGYLEELFWRFLPSDVRRARGVGIERTLRAGLIRSSSPSLKSTYFRAFRSMVTTPEGVAFLERVWRRREKVPGLTLAETDETSMALDLAVRSVPATAAILEEQRARIENPDRRARFEFVMPAVSARSETRDAFFESLADVRNRRREPWVIEGLSYLNHPLRADESTRYLRPALDLLEDIKRTGDIFFPRNWMDAMLSGHQSAGAADIVHMFLSERPEYPVRLRQIVLQSADDLLRAVRIAEGRR